MLTHGDYRLKNIVVDDQEEERENNQGHDSWLHKKKSRLLDKTTFLRFYCYNLQVALSCCDLTFSYNNFRPAFKDSLLQFEYEQVHHRHKDQRQYSSEQQAENHCP